MVLSYSTHFGLLSAFIMTVYVSCKIFNHGNVLANLIENPVWTLIMHHYRYIICQVLNMNKVKLWTSQTKTTTAGFIYEMSINTSFANCLVMPKCNTLTNI